MGYIILMIFWIQVKSDLPEGAFIIWKGGKSLNACILGVNKDYENGRNLQKEGGISTPVMY